MRGLNQEMGENLQDVLRTPPMQGKPEGRGGQDAAAKRDFAAEGLTLNFVSVSRYLGAYLGPLVELEVWVKPQV